MKFDPVSLKRNGIKFVPISTEKHQLIARLELLLYRLHTNTPKVNKNRQEK